MHLLRICTRRPSTALLASIVLAFALVQFSACTEEKTSSTAQIEGDSLTPTLTDTSVDADVPFVVTPQKTVNKMLELAGVTEEDVVYDLGSGDGRIPIAAAQKYGARGVGIEIKPDLVQRARKNAKLSGVSDKVQIRQQDIFEADFRDATVVTMYLFPDVNIKLRPMLFEQLEPGARVVSHSFDMNEWEPDTSVNVDGDILYRWTIPEETPDFVRENF